MRTFLARIRRLMPPALDGHYEAIEQGFERGGLTVPVLPLSDIQLGRALSDFTGMIPSEATVAILNARLHLKR